MEVVTFILSVVSSVVSAMLIFVLQSIIKENRNLKIAQNQKKADRDEALANGMVCVLRKHLMDEHEKWMSKGYITSTALENGLAMYHAYKKLGGNGMIDHMNDDIAELPVRD